MAEQTLMEKVIAMSGSGELRKAYFASCERQQTEERQRLDEFYEKYGTWDKKTPEQQAAFDAMMAENPVEIIETQTEEDEYEWFCERYIETHGHIILHPSIRELNIDWERVRKMAEAHGYVKTTRPIAD